MGLNWLFEVVCWWGCCVLIVGLGCGWVGFVFFIVIFITGVDGFVVLVCFCCGLVVLLVCGFWVVLGWISLDVWVVFCCGVLGVNLYILFFMLLGLWVCVLIGFRAFRFGGWLVVFIDVMCWVVLCVCYWFDTLVFFIFITRCWVVDGCVLLFVWLT